MGRIRERLDPLPFAVFYWYSTAQQWFIAQTDLAK
ncbi:Uncharacterised protein [Vibrio cholerae]|nr:Uncharacterised protein [Vibrio cholerae]